MISISGNVMFLVVGVLIVPFIFVIVITLIKSMDNRKKMQMKADLYAKALEKGVELPKGILDTPPKKGNSLKSGIILIFIGIGITIFMYLGSPRPGQELRFAATGLVPLFLGIGLVVVHFIFKKYNIPDEE